MNFHEVGCRGTWLERDTDGKFSIVSSITLVLKMQTSVLGKILNITQVFDYVSLCIRETLGDAENCTRMNRIM